MKNFSTKGQILLFLYYITFCIYKVKVIIFNNKILKLRALYNIFCFINLNTIIYFRQITAI